VVVATDADIARVADLIGREPSAAFDVTVRGADGDPVVIRNAPFLRDGTPMPTRYWLVDPSLNARVSTLESHGGVRAAERALDPDVIAAAHEAYRIEREAAIPADHIGPRPSGGVAGTARGVKCLHAHYAAFLAGTGDPVGAWVQVQLDAVDEIVEETSDD
jgi:hypothetical protein